MLLTEEQARKTIRCHRSRGWQICEHNDGSVVHEKVYGRCLGKNCSAWRWYFNIVINIRNTDDPTAICVKPPEKSDRGYCGLAGKP